MAELKAQGGYAILGTEGTKILVSLEDKSGRGVCVALDRASASALGRHLRDAIQDVIHEEDAQEQERVWREKGLNYARIGRKRRA